MLFRLKLIIEISLLRGAELLGRCVGRADWTAMATRRRLLAKFRLNYPHNADDANSAVGRLLLERATPYSD